MKKAIIPTTAAIIMLLPVCHAQANLINSNSIVQDEIEYYIQTDKAVYDLGEQVQMLYKVTNLRSEDVTFVFPHSPEWNFWVQKDQAGIWRAVNGWWTVGTSFTLSTNESKDYPCTWNMRDDGGNLVNAGGYDVIGGFDAGTQNYPTSKVAVPITIVPEPCSLILFVASLSILIRKGYRESKAQPDYRKGAK